MTKVRLCVGDWSDDGHGKSETYVVEIKEPVPNLSVAYSKGVEKIGVNIEALCGGYEENCLSSWHIETLKNHGIIVDPMYVNPSEDGEEAYIGPEEYVRLWMMIAHAGEPTMEWYLVQDTSPWLDIGGYGVFS